MRGNVEGIGFAIPINDAIEIASELIEHGYITGRPLIGITVQTATSAHAEYFGWVVGAYVRTVAEESAAERAGLMIGDIIVKLGDTEIDSYESLVFNLRRYRAGETTNITVWRGGDEITMQITFDENLTAGQPRRP
jgi:serine protease Do